MSTLNLIPPRVGFVRLDPNGEYVLTRDGFLFLRDVFTRVGGTDSQTNSDFEILAQFDSHQSQEESKRLDGAINEVALLALQFPDFAEIRKEIAALWMAQEPDRPAEQGIEQSELGLSAAIAELKKQIEELQTIVSLFADPSAALAESNKILATKAPSSSPSLTSTTTDTLKVTSAAPAVAAGQIGIGSGTSTTIGAAGAASALPATPEGYLIFNVAGTDRKIPYYLA